MQIGLKKAIFAGGFTKFFSELSGLQQKLLILIESPNIFHWKSKKESGCGLKGQNLAKLGPVL